jgi:hypothetical protein
VPDVYPVQLDRFLTVLRARQSQAEGGWGSRLDVVNTPLSIVTTMQALRALRAVRVPYDDPAVQAGLRYLAAKVQVHPFRQTKATPEGRGAHPRFCAFGLLGLTTWDEGRHDQELWEAQRFCVNWLEHEALEHGGWADAPEENALSLTATSPAIRALERICPSLDVAGKARELAREARDEMVRQAQGRTSHRWWAQHPEWTEPSYATTSLAVLALVSGAPEHREAAEAGARWLMQNASAWTTLIEIDWRIFNRQWTHMTFSLALRAVVGPAGRVDPADARLKPAIEHLYHLWSEEDGAWLHGAPNRAPTTSGSGAVISAAETLRRHWRFDPLADVRRRRVRPTPPPVPDPIDSHPLRVELRRNRAMIVEEDGSEYVNVDLTRSPQQRELLEILAERHRAGAAEQELRARTVAAGELAQRLRIRPDSVRRMADRLNEKVRAVQGLNVLVQVLVEDREADGEPGVTRWGLTLDVASDDPVDMSAAEPGT